MAFGTGSRCVDTHGLRNVGVLVENAGPVGSSDEFVERVWPDTLVDDVALVKTISQLRKLGNSHGWSYLPEDWSAIWQEQTFHSPTDSEYLHRHLEEN